MQKTVCGPTKPKLKLLCDTLQEKFATPWSKPVSARLHTRA